MDLQERVRQAVEADLARRQAPGAAVAVLLDGAPVLADGFGGRDPGGAVPLEAEAEFYIYSITKPLLAVLVMQLAGAGRLELDGAVQEYLPGLRLDAPVTVRQLLNHTGGIPDYGGLPAYWEGVKSHPEGPWTKAEFLTATLPRGLLFPPGQGWSYSNIGYLLVRDLIERVTGLSYGQALEQGIFGPLGLRRTRVARSLDDARPITPGYSRFFNPDRLEDVRDRYHPGWVSHGLVIATASELAAIFEALFAGRLLAPEWVAEMLANPALVPVEHEIFKIPAYGLGLMIDLGAPWGRIAGHGGGGPGYSTGALVFLGPSGQRITSVALANSDTEEIGLALAFRAGAAVAEAVEGE